MRHICHPHESFGNGWLCQAFLRITSHSLKQPLTLRMNPFVTTLGVKSLIESKTGWGNIFFSSSTEQINDFRQGFPFSCWHHSGTERTSVSVTPRGTLSVVFHLSLTTSTVSTVTTPSCGRHSEVMPLSRVAHLARC